MLRWGSRFPGVHPVNRVSKSPLIAAAAAAVAFIASMTTLIPTAFSWAWMNCATRRFGVTFPTSRCTVGFGKPALTTSAFACSGLYGVQGTFVASNQVVFAGETMVQLGD